MEDTKSKIYLNWDEIERLTNLLSVKIKMKQFQIDSIMGLPRGGLVPAVILSHKLNLPLVQKISQNTRMNVHSLRPKQLQYNVIYRIVL